MMRDSSYILNHPALVSFWDFQEEGGTDRHAKGPYPYKLVEMVGPIERVEEGIFGPYSARIQFGQWWNLPRSQCPALDFHGSASELTIIAWVKRENRENKGCEAVAGMWNETEMSRQYCMFLNLGIWESRDQVCGHVSSVGGPTPGYKYCMTTAIGATPITKGEWHAVAFTYDGTYSKVYLDGTLDKRDTYNPFLYNLGLYDGGANGADFTVAAVNRSGEMGNFFAGGLGGLAVFREALNEDEIASMATVEATA